MSVCPAFGAGATGMAAALRAIDCRTGEATAYAFGRLFGADGRLMPVLTACLTLYVAFFAMALLTGRTRLGVAALTPRMLTLGLVLTFATSWAAYQNVIWALASGAGDQVASLLMGTRGSATIAFADRLDQLFATLAEAAHQAGTPAAATDTGITPAAATVHGFSAATALWLCAILLMLGTAGVLVTAKIALAALLAIGPLFVLLALFGGTRGLFEGWLKAVALFALVPPLAVLIGGGALSALSPLVADIAAAGAQPAPREVAVLFLGVCVYGVLMLMVLKTATTIIAGWRLPGAAAPGARGEAPGAAGLASAPAPAALAPAPAAAAGDDRIRRMLAALPAPVDGTAASPGAGGGGRATVTRIVASGGEAARPLHPQDRRGDRIGSRFRAPPASLPKGHVS
ncbi:type IV secretion system protein [Sphingomonas morindae]|uniref:Type IV secretion system protein n=1 Tax=Sphingomonas morindae TaxID=1541170 RepID=A0ABY4X920_9SPHN|nr:type IV secretion system protein [Sphingomonas morindae]USI73439.1 type IV secretion system protein [Sphingomonas morindae]